MMPLPPWVRTLLIAVLIWIVVGFLLVVVIGPLIQFIKTPPTTFVGGIFIDYGWAIGLFFALWYLVTGGTWRFYRGP